MIDAPLSFSLGERQISKENQTQAIVDKAVANGKTPYIKVFILSKCLKKFWKTDVINELCRTCRDTILLAEKGLSEEQITLSVQAFPENILKTPLWYREKLRENKEMLVAEDTVNKIEHVHSVETKVNDIIESYSQMSIWDILTC